MTDHAHLDAKIHERVMGQTWDASRCRVCGGVYADQWGDGPRCTTERCVSVPQPEARADTPPPYSTDLAAVWRVVERLREQGWWVKIVYVARDRELPGYEVEFRYVWITHVPSSRYRHGAALELPEAIGLAALETTV